MLLSFADGGGNSKLLLARLFGCLLLLLCCGGSFVDALIVAFTLLVFLVHLRFKLLHLQLGFRFAELLQLGENQLERLEYLKIAERVAVETERFHQLLKPLFGVSEKSEAVCQTPPLLPLPGSLEAMTELLYQALSLLVLGDELEEEFHDHAVVFLVYARLRQT